MSGNESFRARAGEAWRELVDHQCGIVSTGQAEQHGWTRHARAAQVSAGRWQRVQRGVYATSTGALSYDARLWAGVLGTGPGSVISHASALWLADRSQPELTVVHLLVPRTQNSRIVPGLRVHRGDYAEQDLMADGCPPRTRVERSVLDAAATASSDDRAVAIVAGAVQRRLTRADRLLTTLARLRTLPRRALLANVLVLCGEGAHSLLEVEHERIRVGHGLPQPQRQRRRGSAIVDVDHGGVIVELDGRPGHFAVDDWWKDMFRDALLTVTGNGVLRFPGFILFTKPHVVAHLEAAALRARGWAGPLLCPPGCPGLPEVDAL